MQRTRNAAGPTPHPAIAGDAGTSSLGLLDERTDHVGMFVPPAAGANQLSYRIDDNAAALVLVTRADRLPPDERSALALRYAALLQNAWHAEARTFRGHLTAGGEWHETADAEEHDGRIMWALGQVIEDALGEALRAWAEQLYREVLPAVRLDASPLTVAYALLGASAVLRTNPDHRESTAAVEQGAEILERVLGPERRPAWSWFEAVLGGDSPRLAQALIEAGDALRRSDWTALGVEALGWIADHRTKAQRQAVASSLPGRDRSAADNEQRARAAQALVEAALSAWQATGDDRWRSMAEAARRSLSAARVAIGDMATTGDLPSNGCFLAAALADAALAAVGDQARQRDEPCCSPAAIAPRAVHCGRDNLGSRAVA